MARSLRRRLGERLLTLAAALTLAALGTVLFPGLAGATTTTYTSAGPIAINDATVATPYPSSISVPALTGNVTDVNVSLNSLTHTYSDDVDIMLVHAGQAVMIMSDVGGSGDLGFTLVLDDEATSSMPDETAITAGSWRPTNFVYPETLPAPAPSSTTGYALWAFDGLTPNGSWDLYVFDDASGDSGSLASWSVTITTPDLSPPVNSAAPTLSGTAKVGQTLTATNGTWAGSPDQYEREWYRMPPGGGTPALISGVTGLTYVLTTADVNQNVYIRVRAHNAAGWSDWTWSAGKGPVQPADTGGDPADVELTGITASPTTIGVGTVVHITLTARNNGPAAASQVWVHLDDYDAETFEFSGVTCAGGTQYGEGCRFTSLAKDATVSVQLDLSYEGPGEEEAGNTYDISGIVSATSDSNSANNWRRTQVTVGGGSTGEDGRKRGGEDGDGGGRGVEAAPVITRFSLSPKTFRAAKKGAMMTRVATGTTVTFGLSKASTATFKVQKAVTGRKVGKVCRPLSRANRKKAKCTRWVAVTGSASEAGKAGTNRCRFTGRVKGRALKPGTYRLSITAKTARSAASKVRTATFRVVR